MSVFLAALISGLIATIVSIAWYGHAEKKRNKMEIFKELMGYRFEISMPEVVHALNLVDVVFYKNRKVRQAYEKFIEEAGKPEDGTRDIDARFLKLLEEIALDLRMKDIQWDTIKKFYYPTGLADARMEESKLRKLRIKHISNILAAQGK